MSLSEKHLGKLEELQTNKQLEDTEEPLRKVDKSVGVLEEDQTEAKPPPCTWLEPRLNKWY